MKMMVQIVEVATARNVLVVRVYIRVATIVKTPEIVPVNVRLARIANVWMMIVNVLSVNCVLVASVDAFFLVAVTVIVVLAKHAI